DTPVYPASFVIAGYDDGDERLKGEIDRFELFSPDTLKKDSEGIPVDKNNEDEEGNDQQRHLITQFPPSADRECIHLGQLCRNSAQTCRCHFGIPQAHRKRRQIRATVRPRRFFRRPARLTNFPATRRAASVSCLSRRERPRIPGSPSCSGIPGS